MKASALFVALFFIGTMASFEPPVNWSSITSNELAALPPEAFSNITSDDLESIPSTACVGFNQDQISFVPSAAVSGLQGDCLVNIPAPSMKGWSAWQILNFGTVCSSLSSSQMSNISATSYAGFTPYCTENLETACLGFNSGIVYFSSKVISSLTDTCVKRIPPSLFSHWNASALSSFTFGCFGFTSAQVYYLPPSSYAGFSGFCLEYLQNGACRWLTPEGISQISPQSINYIQSGCMSWINPKSMVGFTAQQFGALGSVCSGITRIQLGMVLPTTFANATYRCISKLDGCCSNLTTAFIRVMSPGRVSAISSDCFNEIPDSNFAAWNLSQVRQFQNCYGLTASQLGNLSENLIPGLSSTCIQNLSPDVFDLLPKSIIQQLTAPQCSSIVSEQVKGMKNETFLKFQPSQLGNFSSASWEDLRLPRAVFLYINLKKDFFQALHHFNCYFNYWFNFVDFKSLFGSELTALLDASDPIFKNLSQVTCLEIAGLKDDEFPKLFKTADSVALLVSRSVSGWRKGQVAQLTNPSVLSGITYNMAQYLASDTIEAFSPAQWPFFPASAISNIEARFIPDINVSAIAVFSKNQTMAFTCSQLNYFTSEQKNAFVGDGLAAFNKRNLFCNPPPPVPPPPPPPRNDASPALTMWVLIGGGGLVLLSIVLAIACSFAARPRSDYSSL